MATFDAIGVVLALAPSRRYLRCKRGRYGMFTGIITDIGTITDVVEEGDLRVRIGTG